MAIDILEIIEDYTFLWKIHNQPCQGYVYICFCVRTID
jgi:hypothetical protein